MKLLFKTSLAFAAAVSISAMIGCNDSSIDDSSQNTGSEFQSLNGADLKSNNVVLSPVEVDLQSMVVAPEVETSQQAEGRTLMLAVSDNEIQIKPMPVEEKASEQPAEQAGVETIEIAPKPGFSRILVNPYTPISGCQSRPINNWTILPDGSGIGYCLYYEITETGRTQFHSRFINGGANVRQLIYQDVNGDHSLTTMSDQSSNGDTVLDYFVATEPGHYYQQVIMYSGQVSDINSVAAVNTSGVDQYEANDEWLKATSLSDGLDYDTYYGDLDHWSDVDYLRYTSEHGQVIQFQLIDPNGIFTLEYLDDQFEWVPVLRNTLLEFTNLSPNQKINMRIRSSINGLAYPGINWGLHIGSKIDRLTNTRTWSPEEENMANPTGMYRKFHSELHWEAQHIDTTGNGISGLRVEYEWGTESPDNPFTYHYDPDVFSDEDGWSRGVIQVDPATCRGIHTYHAKDFMTGDMWSMDYDPGIARYKSVETGQLIGFDRATDIEIHHTCDEEVIYTAAYMSDYKNRVEADEGTATIPGVCSASTHCYEYYIPAGGQPAGKNFVLDNNFPTLNYADYSRSFKSRDPLIYELQKANY